MVCDSSDKSCPTPSSALPVTFAINWSARDIRRHQASIRKGSHRTLSAADGADYADRQKDQKYIYTTQSYGLT